MSNLFPHEAVALRDLLRAVCDAKTKLIGVRRAYSTEIPEFLRDEVDSLLEHLTHLEKPTVFLLTVAKQSKLAARITTADTDEQQRCRDCCAALEVMRYEIHGRIVCRSCFDTAVAKSETEIEV